MYLQCTVIACTLSSVYSLHIFFCLEHKLLNDSQSVNYCYTLFFKHFERNHVHIVCIFLLKELLDLSSFEDDLSKTSSLIRESYTSWNIHCFNDKLINKTFVRVSGCTWSPDNRKCEIDIIGRIKCPKINSVTSVEMSV